MDPKLQQNIIRVAILAVLLIALLGVLILTGLLGCNAVPGGCGIYYFALRQDNGGVPAILVAYGDYGLGNPERLAALLNERDALNTRARTMDMQYLTYANVRDFDLIVVERAKKVCSDKLK